MAGTTIEAWKLYDAPAANALYEMLSLFLTTLEAAV